MESSGYDSFKEESLKNALESRIQRFRCFLDYEDENTLASISRIEQISDPFEQTMQFVDALIEYSALKSLSSQQLASELAKSKDDIQKAELRNSRLLNHLQKNVKVLTQAATNDNKTTLLQEAALTTEFIGEGIPINSRIHLKGLHKALQNQDVKAGVETIELLKQEIALNAIIRKQFILLKQKSEAVTATIKQLKEETDNKFLRSTQIVRCLLQVTGSTEDQLESVVTNVFESQKSSQTQLLQLQQRFDSVSNDFKRKIEKLKEENTKLEQSYTQKYQDEIEQMAMHLRSCLKCDTSSLSASEIAEQVDGRFKGLIEQLHTDDIESAINSLVSKNRELTRLQTQNQDLMEKQSHLIQTLHESAWIRWASDLARDLGLEPSSLTDESSLREAISSRIADVSNEEERTELFDDTSIGFTDLSRLQKEFNSIEKDLAELHNQLIATSETE